MYTPHRCLDFHYVSILGKKASQSKCLLGSGGLAPEVDIMMSNHGLYRAGPKWAPSPSRPVSVTVSSPGQYCLAMSCFLPLDLLFKYYSIKLFLKVRQILSAVVDMTMSHLDIKKLVNAEFAMHNDVVGNDVTSRNIHGCRLKFHQT